MRGNGDPPEIKEQGWVEGSRVLQEALSEKRASPFRMTPHGLYWNSPDEDKSTWLSPPFEIVAHTRNADGKDWGLLLRWYDLDNVMHEWAMPYAPLGATAEKSSSTLLAGGLAVTMTPGA